MDSDRENGLKKDKEQQRKPKTERMVEKEKEKRKQKTVRIDERTWRNDSGSQRQRKWTIERKRTDSGSQ